MKRLNCLKRRFIRDKSFHEMYKRFLDNISWKGYARKAENEQVGKVSNIPHHGVTHTAKTGTVRVFFNCSRELAGTSLKKQLTAGPDLTNQLVGVLTRFWEEHNAYMADREAMFDQMRVPGNGSWGLTQEWKLRNLKCASTYLEVNHRLAAAITL